LEKVTTMAKTLDIPEEKKSFIELLFDQFFTIWQLGDF